jgi:hypothetical protein
VFFSADSISESFFIFFTLFINCGFFAFLSYFPFLSFRSSFLPSLLGFLCWFFLPSNSLPSRSPPFPFIHSFFLSFLFSSLLLFGSFVDYLFTFQLFNSLWIVFNKILVFACVNLFPQFSTLFSFFLLSFLSSFLRFSLLEFTVN